LLGNHSPIFIISEYLGKSKAFSFIFKNKLTAPNSGALGFGFAQGTGTRYHKRKKPP